jgi:predicted ribosome quality control (RQC) complex YloA/Tae2 family protein
MYDEASSLDIHHLADELSVLEGGKINKVYEWDDQEAFIFKIYSEGETRHLRLQLPGLIYVTERRFQAPKIPPGYARFLRNKLTASRIESVEQHSFDRLLEFSIHSKRHGDFKLIFELFKPANLVLVDDDNMIVHPYRQQSFKDRTIRSNQQYRYPPERPDTPGLSVDELSDLLHGDDNVERVVATRLGLGGVYASEVTARTDIDPSVEADDLTDEQRRTVSEAVQDLLNESNPCIIDGEAYPVEMHSLPDSAEHFDTFSDALDTVHDYDQVIKHGSSTTNKQEKYQTIIDAQQKQIEQFEDAIEDNQRKANYIYENYNDFATMIYTLRDKKEHGELDSALDDIDNVVDYDPAANEVTLRFDVDDEG